MTTNAAPCIKVLLADGRSLLRAGLCKIIQENADIIVVGEAHRCAGVASGIRELSPKVVVVGVLEDCADPLDAVRAIEAEVPPGSARFLVLCDPPGPSALAHHRDLGLLLTSTEPQEFCTAIRMLAAGYSFLAPLDRDRHGAADHRMPQTRTECMTGRELDVLRLLARGHTNAEISRALTLSESTIKSHVQSLLSKLQLRNRVGAVIYAYESGLVKIGDNIADLPSLTRPPTMRGRALGVEPAQGPLGP